MRINNGNRKRSLLKLKSFFKEGGGEIMSFMLCLPVLLFMLYAIVDIIHVGTIDERLEYTAYKAARAAVVADSLEKAQKAAYKTAEKDLKNNKTVNLDMKASNWLKVEVIMADGKDRKEIEKAKKTGSLARVGPDVEDEDSNSTWEKGNFIQCTVTAKFKTYGIFSAKQKSATITMMIEKLGDTEGEGVYPWFRNL